MIRIRIMSMKKFSHAFLLSIQLYWTDQPISQCPTRLGILNDNTHSSNKNKPLMWHVMDCVQAYESVHPVGALCLCGHAILMSESHIELQR